MTSHYGVLHDPSLFRLRVTMADRRYTINSFTVNLDLPPDVDPRLRVSPRSAASIERSVEGLFALLNEHDIRATFFISEGAVSSAAATIRRLIDAGHEPAILAPRFNTPLDQLLHMREEISGARARLEDVTGSHVAGIRSTPFTNRWRSPSMLETLVQEGFTYSSSTYPRQSLSPLLLSRAKRAHRLATPSGVLWELPLTAWRPLGLGIPSINTAGGPLFSLLPAWVIVRGVEGMNRHGEPAILYVHSWGLDTVDHTLALRNDGGGTKPYGPIEETLGRLRTVFRIYRFASIREAFASRLTTESTGATPLRRTSIQRFDGA